MNGVAIGVKNAQKIRRQIDAGPEYVGCRDYDVFGKGAVSVNTDPLGIVAQMQAASESISATAAHNMAFARDDVAHL